jgi:hypothetical protein
MKLLQTCIINGHKMYMTNGVKGSIIKWRIKGYMIKPQLVSNLV